MNVWKTINLFLLDRGTNINKITIVDNDKVISNDEEQCKIFSNFFQEAVKTLGVSDNFNLSSYSHSDPVNNAKQHKQCHKNI